MDLQLIDALRGLDVVRDWHLPARADEAKAADGSLGLLEVRFSKFGVWYEVDSWWEGRFMERTQRGAFAKTIAESGMRTKVLFNHGMDFSIGDKLLGPIDQIAEERDSPMLLSSLFDTSYNRDLLPGLRAGVYGSSFMFRVVKDEWDHEPDVSEHNPEALPERTITEVRLFEAGPVTWPANPDATAGMRAMSGTDRYYENLRSRDPRWVDELRSRFTALRTPATPSAARASTDGAAAAPATTDEPAARHSAGLTHAQRRARLYPTLMGAPSDTGRAPGAARSDRD